MMSDVILCDSRREKITRWNACSHPPKRDDFICLSKSNASSLREANGREKWAAASVMSNVKRSTALAKTSGLVATITAGWNKYNPFFRRRIPPFPRVLPNSSSANFYSIISNLVISSDSSGPDLMETIVANVTDFLIQLFGSNDVQEMMSSSDYRPRKRSVFDGSQRKIPLLPSWNYREVFLSFQVKVAGLVKDRGRACAPSNRSLKVLDDRDGEYSRNKSRVVIERLR